MISLFERGISHGNKGPDINPAGPLPASNVVFHDRQEPNKRHIPLWLVPTLLSVLSAISMKSVTDAQAQNPNYGSSPYWNVNPYAAPYADSLNRYVGTLGWYNYLNNGMPSGGPNPELGSEWKDQWDQVSVRTEQAWSDVYYSRTLYDEWANGGSAGPITGYLASGRWNWVEINGTMQYMWVLGQ